MPKKTPKLYFTDLPFEQALHPEVLRVWNLPQYKQRTKIWYKMRKNGITASSVASTLMQSEDSCRLWIDSYNQQDKFVINPNKNCSYMGKETLAEFILSKCGMGKPFTGNEYTRWGQKYEPIVTTIYSQLNQVDMLEFGLIFHPDIPFLAASPDGISTQGRMLEIKCPPCRPVKPFPPIYYHQQILMQLICTNLKECDYMDAQFVEYVDADDWEKEARQWEQENPDAKHHLYGIILTYEYEENEPEDPDSDEEDEEEEEQEGTENINVQESEVTEETNVEPPAPTPAPAASKDDSVRLKHIYAPPNVVKIDEFIEWAEQTREEYAKQDRELTTTYYKLHQYHICLVKTSPEWFEKNFESMKKVWEQIEQGRTKEGQDALRQIVDAKEEKKNGKRLAKKEAQKQVEKMGIFLDLDLSSTSDDYVAKKRQTYVHDECLL